jgi:tRNA (guanine10-N2)-methyltransferase
VYEFYAQGSSYEELHQLNRANQALWSPFVPDTSFKFVVTAYSHRIPQSRQHEIIESFSYMGFLGKIDMKQPEIILGCLEECTPYTVNLSPRCLNACKTDHDRHKTTRDRHQGDGDFRQAYFGRLVRPTDQ